jgi:tetratricopeptide (TPR) repeat protein
VRKLVAERQDVTTNAPRPWLLVVGALVLVLSAYFRVLDGPFIWDDRALIVGDKAVTTFASPVQLLVTPFWSENPDGRSSRAFYRPLTSLSYAVDFRIHGENATGFHLTNVFLHLLNVVLLFVLARRSGASPPIAALIAAVWGLLPRLAESVGWISGRTDVLAATMCFAALLIWRRDSLKRSLLTSGFLFLGLLAKEVTAAAFLAIFVSEMVADRQRSSQPTPPTPTRPLLAAGAPLLLVAVVYGALRTAALGSRPPLPPYAISMGARIALPFEAIGTYAWMLVDAFRARTQIGMVAQRSNGLVVLGIAVLLAVTAALWRYRAKITPRGSKFLTLGFTALAMVFHLARLPIDVVAADRFLYIPTAALLLAAIGPLEHLAVVARRAFAPLAFVVLLALVGTTFARSLDWADEVRFWVDAVATTSPKNDLPRNELGNVFYRAGLYQKAIHHYEEALGEDLKLARPPNTMSLRGNLAHCFQKLGRYDESLTFRRSLVDDFPNVARVHFDLAVTSLSVLQFDVARRELRTAIERFPQYDAARELLGKVDDYEVRTRKLIVQAPPGERDHASVVDLAHLFQQLGRYQDAITAWEAVIASPKVTPEEAREAAVFLVRETDPKTAHETVERLEAVAPNEAEPVRLLLAARLTTIERLTELATD